uniref:Secreted protein n=1 Tax=Knipowitschia caucasica TaxID=637954 RepID=A0AAV2LY79_KNICA
MHTSLRFAWYTLFLPELTLRGSAWPPFTTQYTPPYIPFPTQGPGYPRLSAPFLCCCSFGAFSTLVQPISSVCRWVVCRTKNQQLSELSSRPTSSSARSHAGQAQLQTAPTYPPTEN